MTIFSEFGFRRSRLPLVNAQAFALEQLISIHCVDRRSALGDG